MLPEVIPRMVREFPCPLVTTAERSALFISFVLTNTLLALTGSFAAEPVLPLDSVVAKINGLELKLKAYHYFLKDARSEVIAEISNKSSESLGDADLWQKEINGVKASELVKRKALAKATEYYALIAKATELGLATYKDEPFYQANLPETRKNKTMYGPRLLSEDMVVSAYVGNLHTRIKEKTVPESLFPEEVRKAYYDQHPEIHNRREMVVIRKIYLSYQPGNKAGKKQVMETLLQRLKAGESFPRLAAEYSEKITENEWVNYDEEGRQMIMLSRPPEDWFLREDIRDMTEGELRGVADNGQGFYIVKCEKVTDRAIGFYEVADKILRILIETKYAGIAKAFTAAANVELNQEVYASIIIN